MLVLCASSSESVVSLLSRYWLRDMVCLWGSSYLARLKVNE